MNPASAPAPTRKPAPAVTEKDVFVPSLPELDEVCDACSGGKVRARYTAKSETKGELFYCAHHIRKYEDKLKTDGFSIAPEDTSYTAGFNNK
jgi:hypothetical protein